ncbi:MAG: YggT family protein [Simkaniaceae bacterium]|nr:YggT family protein [Simkaniaceae bacterium]
MLGLIIKYLFNTYTILIFGRIIMSWIPQLAGSWIGHFLKTVTDPYLNLFRKIIPPIGGTIDLSPVVAILALKFVQYILISLIYR